MAKTSEIHFKIEPKQKQKIVEAAEICGRSISSFCTTSLVKAAEIAKYGGSLEMEKALKSNGTSK